MSQRFRFLLPVFFMLAASVLRAQQNESDEKATLRPIRGIHYVEKDSTFSLLFRFRMQNQALLETVAANDLNINATELRIRRLRVRLEGFLLNPRFSYYLQLAFSRADQDLRSGAAPNIGRDAVVYYQAARWWRAGFGQTKLPGNRDRVISSGNLQFADRSIANNIFTLDRDFGFFNYFSFFPKQPVYLKLALSSGEGRNAVNGNSGLCYTSRVEWVPFGKFINEGDYSMGDPDFHPRPALSVGAAFSYNEGAKRIGGQLGNDLYQPADIRAGFADLIFKCRGWAAQAEYFYRSTPGLPQSRIGSPTVYVYSGQGFNVQASRMISRKNELALRYSVVEPATVIRAYEQRRDMFTAGFTRYFAGHRLKAQFNLNYNTQNGNYLLTNPLNTWGCIFQVEVGI